MECHEVLCELRKKKGLTQDEAAEQLMVTRQAISRWENGETVPNTESLKLLSRLYNVSINTLLGSPRKLICQCCGMPLEDNLLSHEADGTINEDYCQWCYVDGQFVYHNMEEMVEFLAAHMAGPQADADAVRAWARAELPKLRHWQEK